MLIDGPKALGFLEAAYDDNLSDDAWRESVVRAGMALARARTGAWMEFATKIDAGGDLRLERIDTRMSVGPNFRSPDEATPSFHRLPPQILDALFGRSLAGTFSSLVGDRAPDNIAEWRAVWHHPIVDPLGLVARQPDGTGVLLGSGLESAVLATRRELRILDRLTYHLAAGDRLRRASPTRPLERAEAILTPAGKVLHAHGPAANRHGLIDEGRRRRDEARRTAHDIEKALEVWRSLVAGRWSLVDHFDTDGKRFLLAMKNTPRVDMRADLTSRERRGGALVAIATRKSRTCWASRWRWCRQRFIGHA